MRMFRKAVPGLRFIVCLSLVLACACDARVDAALLDLEGLEEGHLEPGRSLRVDGHGFPPGRPGRVILEGVIHAPGESPRPVEAQSPAQAQSAERLVFEATPTLVTALGGRGTFVGALRVEFDGADGSLVTGVLSPVTLDVHPAVSGLVAGVVDRQRRGQALLDELGIVGRVEDGETRGITVESFVDGGAAHRAGVRKRDRIVALGPMQISALSDLVPPRNAASVELVLVRPGLSQPIRLPVALGVSPEAAGPDGEALLGGAVAIGLAILLLLLVSPAARFTSRICVALVGGSGSSSVLLPPWVARSSGTASPFVRLKRGLWTAVAAVAVTLALGVLPFMASTLPGTVDAAVMVAAIIGLAAAAAASVPASMGARLAAVTRAICVTLPLAFAIGAVAAVHGTFAIEAIARAQGPAPWEWAAFSELPALFAVPAVLLTGLVLSPPPATAATAQVIDRVRLFVAAALVTALFLGGYSLPFAEDPLRGAPHLRVLSALFFVAKSVLLVAVALRLRSVARRPLGLFLWASTFALLAVGAAALTLFVPAWAVPAHLTGPIVFTVAAIVLLVGLLGAARARGAPLDLGGVALTD